jgi:hypothetical protein
MSVNDIFGRWQEGEVESMIALNAIASQLGEVESELAMVTGPLNAERESLRNMISHIADKIGEAIVIPGFGKIEMTAPSSGYKYNTSGIDSVIRQLRAAGHGSIADMIGDTKETTGRSGGLRITLQKKR